ncbi:MAG: FkbM family methyltransferase [Pirellulales bacterium]|nr:FkbM family methyltransferase [Pirellulales bacterium]
MQQIAGIFLPDHEAHMPAYLRQTGGAYQSKQLQRALQFVTNWRTAVDIGAHVGTWSKALVQKFQRVIAFEPLPQLRACLEKNVVSDRLQIIPIALGNEHGAVSFSYDEAHSGATHVEPGKAGLIPLGMLDDFRLEEVDFIKIDTEGFELPVLQGAAKTLAANQPVIIVEDKLHGVKHYGQQPYAVIEFLESLGGVILDRIVDDFIMGWPDTPGKVRKTAPREVEQQFAECMARQQTGDLPGMRLGFRKLTREFPRHAESWNMLAICELQLGHIRPAVAAALNAVELLPTEARLQNTLATALWLNGNIADAVDTLKRALQINPELFEAHLNLGEIYEHARDHSSAFACFQQALRIRPNSPQVLIKMGRIHAAHGSTAQASTLFRQALTLDPAQRKAREELQALESRSRAGM